MNNLLNFLNAFGIGFDENTPLIVLFSGYYLIMSVFV